MVKQLWMIATVWAYRPLMWLVAIAASAALFASVIDRNQTVMRSAFRIPGDDWSLGSIKLTPMSILTNGEEFQQSAQSGEVDTSIEGIDLTSMDLRDPTNPLEDLATVQSAMPDVHVRPAQYNENSISRVGYGSIWIVVLTWMCMFNLHGHFSTPQRRVIPNYEEPHLRFVLGFAVLVVIVSTVAIHTPVAVAWLPAMAVSVLAVAIAELWALWVIINLRRPALGWVPIVIIMALFLFQWIRPVLRQAIPAMEPAVDHFLGGHHPVLAIVIAAACLLAIYWMISQFTDYDRLNAEAGLPPAITGNDLAKQSEILRSRLGGKQRALDTSLNAWHSKLATIKSKPAGWLRDIRLDWMGESTVTFVLWTGLLVGATVVTFFASLFSDRGREFAAMYVCVGVGVALIIPLLASLSRREVMPLELLLPRSRAQFLRRRTLSIAAKYAYMFAGLFVQVAIVQYFCFHTLKLESPVRAAIVIVPITMAGTGLVVWGSSIRNIFALGLLVVVGLVILTFASFAFLDFRWIDDGNSGEQIHAFVTSPLFYAVSYLVAGLMLWTGYDRLSRCELARQ